MANRYSRILLFMNTSLKHGTTLYLFFLNQRSFWRRVATFMWLTNDSRSQTTFPFMDVKGIRLKRMNWFSVHNVTREAIPGLFGRPFDIWPSSLLSKWKCCTFHVLMRVLLFQHQFTLIQDFIHHRNLDLGWHRNSYLWWITERKNRFELNLRHQNEELRLSMTGTTSWGEFLLVETLC
jgi:hypothetical protein